MEPSSVINYISVAKTDQEAIDLAKNFFEFEDNESGTTILVEGREAKLYFLSAENMFPKVHCPTFVDCALVLCPEEEGEEFEILMKDLEIFAHWGILIGFNRPESAEEEDNSWFFEKENISSEKAKNLVQNKPFELNEKIKKAFQSMNVDSNGRICKADIAKIYTELTGESASCDKTGQGWRNWALTFEQVKSAYFYGQRQDKKMWGKTAFQKKIIKILDNKNCFEEFVESLKLEVKGDFEPAKLNITVGEQAETNSGIGIKASIKGGSAFSQISSNLPSEHQNLSFAITLKAKIKNSFDLKKILKFAQSLKSILLSDDEEYVSEEFKEVIIGYGTGMSVYTENGQICFEIKSAGGLENELAFLREELVDLETKSLTGEIEAATALTVEDLFEGSLDEILQKLASFSFNSTGEVKKLESFIGWMVMLLDTPLLEELYIPKEIKKYLLSLTKLISTFKMLETKLVIDTDKMNALLSSDVSEEIKEMFESLRPSIIQGIKGMKEDHEELFGQLNLLAEAVDLDKITIQSSSSILKTTSNLELNLPGLTEAILKITKE